MPTSASPQQIVIKLCQTEDELDQVTKMAQKNIRKGETLTSQQKSKGFLHSLVTDEFLKTSQKFKDLYIAKHKDLVISFIVSRKIEDLWQYPDFQLKQSIFKSMKGCNFQGQQIVFQGKNVFVGSGYSLQQWRKQGIIFHLMNAAIERFAKFNPRLITTINIDNYASLNHSHFNKLENCWTTRHFLLTCQITCNCKTLK